MPTIAVNGEDIFYREEGSGQAVILVHSLGTSSTIWDTTIAALKGNYRVIAMDCRGHGRSTNRTGFNVEAIASDVLCVADALGVSRFHFVGISMGGLFGLTAYARAPERIVSLTLADSYATAGAGAADRLASTRQVFESTPMRTFAEDYVKNTLMPWTVRTVYDEMVNIIAGMTAKNYLQTLEAILTTDVTPQLASVCVPTLIIVGENDQRTPISVSENLKASITNAQVYVVPKAGHLAVLDQPKVFNDKLFEFLDGIQQRF